MPIVKSIAIHDNVRATLRYILNPEKTEGLFLCNSLNCFTNAEDAYLNMKNSYENYTHHKFNEPLPAVGKRRVKAIHYIQSFKPDPNLTPELVHRMGLAFIRKAFGDNVQVVIATHIDKAHYHNHILINTYGIDGHKYNDNYTTRRAIRDHSDRVCLAFDIPVTEAKRKRGLSYCEWKHRKQGTSWKEQIRREIDALVLCCKNFDELAGTLEEKGYTVRYGEQTAIKAPGQKYFTNLKTLGEAYTIESLNIRIQYRDDMGNASREDTYNKGRDLDICYADAITRAAKMIVEGKMKGKKQDDRYPYLPHNDRDVYEMSAQLFLTTRLNIHSIGEVKAKMKKIKEEYDKLVSEFNAITKEHRRITDLLAQYNTLCDLENKPDKNIAEKMKLSLAQKSLSRHGIKPSEDARRLELQKQDYDDRIAEIKQKIDSKDYLIKALQEVSDTIRDMQDKRKGDYVLRLYYRNKFRAEQEAQQDVQDIPAAHEPKPSVQNTPKPVEPASKPPVLNTPKHEPSAPKPPVQDISHKTEQQESIPEKSEPKPDEPAQKPKTKTTSRGLKH